MKFMTERHELPVEEFGTTEKEEPLFLVIPRGVKEGTIKRIRTIGRDARDADSRASNAEVLRLVREWNFDDEAGVALPLLSTLMTDEKALWDLPAKRKAEVEHVLENCPATLFKWLAEVLINRKPFSEAAEGFLKTS